MSFEDKEVQWKEEEFIDNNIRLVYAALWKLGKSPQDPDMLQYGKIAMLQALRSFDPNRDTKFSTYYYAYLRNAITPCIRCQKDTNAREINNYPCWSRDGISYGNLDEFCCHKDTSEILDQVDTQIIVDKIINQLTSEEQDILKDIYYNENTIRNGVSDITNSCKTQKIFRRRQRLMKKVIQKARGIADLMGLE